METEHPPTGPSSGDNRLKLRDLKSACTLLPNNPIVNSLIVIIGLLAGISQLVDFVRSGKLSITLLSLLGVAVVWIVGVVCFLRKRSQNQDRSQVTPSIRGRLLRASNALGAPKFVGLLTLVAVIVAVIALTRDVTDYTYKPPPKAANPPTNEVPVNPNRASRDTLYVGESLGVDQLLTSQDGRYRLVVQKDGNVVEYDPEDKAIWTSNTLGREAWTLLNQRDGNIVVKDAVGNTLCAFGTSGRKDAYLIMRNDGHLVVYAPGYDSIWDSQGEEKGQCV